MTKAVCNLARVVTNRRQMFLEIYILMDTIKEIELEQIFVPFIDYNKKNYIYHVFTFTLLLFFFFFTLLFPPSSLNDTIISYIIYSYILQNITSCTILLLQNVIFYVAVMIVENKIVAIYQQLCKENTSCQKTSVRILLNGNIQAVPGRNQM